MKLFILNKKIVGESILNPSKYAEVNEWVSNLNDKKTAEMWYFDDGTVQVCNASDVFGTVYNFVARIGKETCFIPDEEGRDELCGVIDYAAAVALLNGNESEAIEHGYRIIKHVPSEYVEFNRCAVKEDRNSTKGESKSKQGNYLRIEYTDPQTGDVHRYYTDDPAEYLTVLYECCSDLSKPLLSEIKWDDLYDDLHDLYTLIRKTS